MQIYFDVGIIDPDDTQDEPQRNPTIAPTVEIESPITVSVLETLCFDRKNTLFLRLKQSVSLIENFWNTLFQVLPMLWNTLFQVLPML